jgi:hydroxymethylpyrimidine/phosphomethylpyrimidine kinase
MIPVLTIAGVDPSGGAGILADVKTFHQHGLYGMAVPTLLTVQNTQGVSEVQVLDGQFVLRQLNAVIKDIEPRAAKSGALGSVDVIRVIARAAKEFIFPLVVDPVMISKHGHELLAANAVDALKRELFPHAFLITPNAHEASALVGWEVKTKEQAMEACVQLAKFRSRAVLIKGGHLNENEAVDVLYYQEKHTVFSGPRVKTKNTHGTGCTLSAAITCNLALGHSLEESVARAKNFLTSALESAPDVGKGVGPVNHFATVKK